MRFATPSRTFTPSRCQTRRKKLASRAIDAAALAPARHGRSSIGWRPRAPCPAGRA